MIDFNDIDMEETNDIGLYRMIYGFNQDGSGLILFNEVDNDLNGTYYKKNNEIKIDDGKMIVYSLKNQDSLDFPKYRNVFEIILDFDYYNNLKIEEKKSIYNTLTDLFDSVLEKIKKI
jgi:hypothetical protein